MLFKTLLIFSVCLSFLITSPVSYADVDKGQQWQQLKTQYFSDRPIRNQSSDLLFIEVPNQVEDAAFLPITIKSMGAQTPNHHIQTLHLIIDNNPEPYSAAFHFSPSLGAINLSTRIRMESFSTVRVIAEMNDGSLHMQSRFVIASGGCSAPASKDTARAQARLGKIKIRTRKFSLGQTVTSQVLISHPNYNGLQFDDATRQYIPAHYITNMTVEYNGTTLINAELGISISENPSIRFDFTPTETGRLSVVAKDNLAGEFTASKTFPE